LGKLLQYSFRELFGNTATRLILLVFLFLILTVSALVYTSYRNHISSAREHEFEKLENCTELLAASIPAADHLRLTTQLTQYDAVSARDENEIYERISLELERYKKTFELQTDIYTLILHEGVIHFAVSSSESPYYMHSWDHPDPLHFSRFDSGAQVGPYEDENGTWLSSFKPIVLNGETVALVQADSKFDVFIQEARQEFVSSMLIFLLIIAVSSYFLIQMMNSILSKENKVKQKLLDQANEIQEKNQDLMSSLRVAKRLQEAVLPNISSIEKVIPEISIMYQPKDIVSGDFYWYEKQGDVVYIAAGDCTGHGIPGAFMSILANSALNTALHRRGGSDLGAILEELDLIVSRSLNKSHSQHRDGMDISICAYDTRSGQVRFAGALRPLIVIKNGELIRIAGDRKGIGFKKVLTSYTEQQIDAAPGDVIYMFSDGYADQFGGAKGKKYMSKRFRKFLMEIQEHPIEEQKYLLQYEFHAWKDELEQVDDVLVLGFKVPERA
jgi:serine phosphatase RsbU (regulator of sigma subunit)